MIKIITLFCLLLINFESRAQYDGFSLLNNAESFKKSFAVATATTECIQSDFSQEKTLTMLSEKMYSAGKFSYKKKGRLRMEYLQPYQYLMILNDGKIFIKEGQKENKISANSNKVFHQVNRILIDCISGNMLENTDFQSRVFESPRSFLVELRPVAKNLKDQYKNINIVIDRKDYTAISIEMYELSGDKTIIRFQNKELNAHIPDSTFNIP
jgi:outer membrane lipoprotein-sorting protein